VNATAADLIDHCTICRDEQAVVADDEQGPLCGDCAEHLCVAEQQLLEITGLDTDE
jgi:hypothetical protein